MYSSFPVNLLELMPCQKDASVLKIEEADIAGGRCRKGVARCGTCGVEYPIVDGILDLLSNQPPLDKISHQEVVARDQEAESYDDGKWGAGGSDIEQWIISEHLEPLNDKTVIEFGCGTGRITSMLGKTAGRIVALDFSTASLHVLARKLAADAAIGLIQADATRVVVARGGFDTAISSQVLEHFPSLSHRVNFMEGVRHALVPGGMFICTAYYQDIRRRLRRLPAEGVHDSRIFFHCFSVRELRELMSPYFDELHVHPAQVMLPFLKRLGLSGPISRRLTKAVENWPGFREFGILVLARGRAVDGTGTLKHAQAG